MTELQNAKLLNVELRGWFAGDDLYDWAPKCWAPRSQASKGHLHGTKAKYYVGLHFAKLNFIIGTKIDHIGLHFTKLNLMIGMNVEYHVILHFAKPNLMIGTKVPRGLHFAKPNLMIGTKVEYQIDLH